MGTSMTPLNDEERWFRDQAFWALWLATCNNANACAKRSFAEAGASLPHYCSECGWNSQQAWDEATKRVIETRNK
jgi:hypothetical protein